MANRVYLSLWLRDFTEATMLERFQATLSTLPFSTTRPGITWLTVRALDSSESPIEEHDLRSAPATAEGCASLARLHEHFDCSYEAQAHWDLWAPEGGGWKRTPQPLTVICNGEQYDEGAFREAGHLQIDLGPDDLFMRDFPAAEASKLRENVAALREWLTHIKRTIPIERYTLWSEEDEQFEARLEGALANS